MTTYALLLNVILMKDMDMTLILDMLLTIHNVNMSLRMLKTRVTPANVIMSAK